MATLKTVISGWDARRIAEHLASKAMEHIMLPLMEDRKKRAIEAMQADMASVGVTMPMLAIISSRINHSYCGDNGTSIIFRNDGNVIEVHVQDALLEGQKPDPERIPVSRYVIRDGGIIAHFLGQTQAYADAKARLDELVEEMEEQISSKTVGTVIKAWPEAADLVCRIVGVKVPNTVPMTTPLSQLLSKYLALPAPATTSEEAA